MFFKMVLAKGFLFLKKKYQGIPELLGSHAWDRVDPDLLSLVMGLGVSEDRGCSTPKVIAAVYCLQQEIAQLKQDCSL